MSAETLNARPASRRNSAPKPLNLALQGAGAHGAFAWGVLDKLLEDGRVRVDGISATGAGALNAVVYAYGAMTGGNEAARTLLESFWSRISAEGNPLQLLRASLGTFLPGYELARAAISRQLEPVAQLLSPYEFNPLNVNPMKAILERMVDFETLHRDKMTKLALGATNVRSGEAKVFSNREITVEAVLASSCLPTLFQAVEIEGEHYWDGSLTGNASLLPLVCKTATRDILAAHIHPIARRDVPRRGPDINNRVNEITANSALANEMRLIGLMSNLLERDWLKPEHRSRFGEIRLHELRSDAVLSDLAVSSKLDTGWAFLTRLRDAGREATELWLDTHFDDIGARSTIDLSASHC